MHGFTKVANSAFYPSPLTFPSHFSPFNFYFPLSLFTRQLSLCPLTFHLSTLTVPSHFFIFQLLLSPLTFHPSCPTLPSHFSPFKSHFPSHFSTLNSHFTLSLFIPQLSLSPLTFHTSILTFPSHISSPTFIPLSFFTTQLSIFPSHFSPFNSLSPLQSAFSCFFSCAYC